MTVNREITYTNGDVKYIKCETKKEMLTFVHNEGDHVSKVREIIEVAEHEDYWTCGDGCCTNFETVSTFDYEGKTYEYRSYDSLNNLRSFLKEVMDISFKFEFEG